MEITFYKYQGTGNDFVVIDNRGNAFPKDDRALVTRLCDRRFGIGGDGLMLLESADGYDFKMVYYNADGRTSSMCGNGGRCLVAFARLLGIIGSHARFLASDGVHEATIDENGLVDLHMADVDVITTGDGYIFLDTGSPHHIEFVPDVRQINVAQLGAKIRYSELYGSEGSNINFAKQNPDGSFGLRTYERGVEDETLSCGTGATATAIAAFAQGMTMSEKITIRVEGGTLEVSFRKAGGRFTNVRLKGPAEMVFKGTVSI
jgi:diaminopimelate epimerase